MSAIKVIREGAVRSPTKFDLACARLEKLAYERGAAARMPTFVELCEQAQVSKATLDAALGQLEAQDVLVRRHGAGIFVSSRLQHTVALVCDPHFSTEPHIRDFWQLLVSEAQARVAGRNQQLAFHFCTTSGDGETVPLHAGLMDDIRAGRVQGVLTVGVPQQAVEWISEQKVAVVAFAGPGPVSVNLHSERVVELGVQALAAQGCQRIAMWSAWFGAQSSDSGFVWDAQRQAFASALDAHQLQTRAEWLQPGPDEISLDAGVEQARLWVRGVFGGARSTWPDGLLITDDNLSRDVLAALAKAGVVPGRDLEIASHANSGSPILRGYEDDLTLIEFDSGEIVQAMFDQLATLERGEVPKQEHIRIEPRIRRGTRN